ncbi:MAG TPA: hypothetical protein VJM46_01575 [Candidatus Saccharimonadales bacterium]|nr:hypothetical protein [Candidatus Saccharimonadales bacterium]
MKRIASSILITLALALGVVTVSPAPAQAANLPGAVTQVAACTGGTFFGFPPWYACLPKDASGGPKLTKLEDLWLIAFPLLETAIKAAGYTAIGFIMWGGIRFIKSQGNPGEITASRDTIRDAVIGLIICISSVAIVQFLASRL